MENISIEKEVCGEKEFLKVVPESADMIIIYQLMMVTGNQIPGFLETVRRQDNDEVALLYDITDKVSLSETIKKRRLTKKELKNLISTVVKAENSGRPYQLANKGILIDLDYIFLSKDRSEIKLMYLPFYKDDTDTGELCRLLKDLIVDGHIENTNDGFVSGLIHLINKENLSYAELGRFIRKETNTVRSKKKEDDNIVNNSGRENQRKNVENRIPSDIPLGFGSAGNRPVPTRPVEDTNKNHAADNKKTKKKNGSSKNSIFFTIAVGVIVLIIATLYAKGVFIVDGKLKTEYLAATVLAGGAVLFILYRELFINNKDKKEKAAPKENAMPEKKKPPIGVKSAQQMGTQEAPQFPAKKPPIKVTPPQAVRKDIEKEPLFKKKTVKKELIPDKPQPPYRIEKNNYPFQPKIDNDVYMDDTSDTVILDDNESSRAYLEYVDNGLSTKFFIDRAGILVGKQKSRVNYSIPVNTVSKVHAEFGMDDEGYYVKDLSSTNGTYINESSRITPKKVYHISDGDVIRLAKVELVFHC